MSSLPAVFLDGDDTLWKTQEMYDEAKQHLVVLLHRIGIKDEDIINKLDELDMQRVSIRGFTSDRFLESMLITYIQLASMQGQHWQAEIEQEIRKIAGTLKRPTKLYQDTLPALEALQGKARIYLYSAGKRGVQTRKAQKLGIAKYFSTLFIVASKNEETLEQILSEVGLNPDGTWLIGNSLRSDVAPAASLGMHTILIERGGWKYDSIFQDGEGDQSYFRVSSLNDAVLIILDWLKRSEKL